MPHFDLHMIFTLFCAALVGSVINMVTYRLPIMLGFKSNGHSHFKIFNLLMPRSHCRHCAHIVPWYNNIPIVSYIILKGHCFSCKAKIHSRYLLTEIGYLILIAGVFIVYPSPQYLLAAAWFTALLMIQAQIDLEFFFLPDIINYILLWSGLFINSFDIFCSLHDAVYGALFSYIGLWFFYHLFAFFTGKKGFGYGDFKFYSAISAWIGIHHIFSCIMLSCVFGIVMSLFWIKLHPKKQHPVMIPFGPALAMSGYFLLLWPKLLQF